MLPRSLIQYVVASKLGFIILNHLMKWQKDCVKCFFEERFGKSLWLQGESSVCTINLGHRALDIRKEFPGQCFCIFIKMWGSVSHDFNQFLQNQD